MATHPLQAESVPANPTPLTLYDASSAFEEMAVDLAELSALVWLASNAVGLEQQETKALRAIVSRLDVLASEAEKHTEAFIQASRTLRAVMQ